MKLSISLNKPKTVQPPAPVPRPSLFSAGDDDDADINEQTFPNPSKSGPVSLNAESSKAMRKRMEAEKRVDQTVYEYDEVWDKMQEAKQRQQAVKEADAAVRKVSDMRLLRVDDR